MKIEVSSRLFAEALSRVVALVSSRSTLPVLSCVALHAEEDRLRLTANNLDQSLTFAIVAQVAERGGVLLPARRLLSIVREMPDCILSLQVGRNFQVTLRGASSRFTVMGMDTAEFPPLGDTAAARVGRVAVAQLRRSMALPGHAMSSDETRYILNGVLFHWGDRGIRTVATDGRRLAVVDVEAKADEAMTNKVIVPAKSVSLLTGLLTSGSSEVYSDGKRLTVAILPDPKDAPELEGEIRFTTKLVDGRYPDYEKVVPQRRDDSMVADIPREDFLAAVHRAALVTSEKTNSVKLDFRTSGCVITAQSPDLGEALEELPSIMPERGAVAAFNPMFLLDALGAVTHDTVKMTMSGEGSPALVEAPGYLEVIMPVRGS